MGKRSRSYEATGLGIQGLVALEQKAMGLSGEPRPSDGKAQEAAEHAPGARAGGTPAPTWIEHPRDSYFGLALSGGGIRSATFNLGLLQGLAKLNLLRVFHYLATVSGGGYIGSFWSAWRARSEARDELGGCGTCPEEERLFPDTPDASGAMEPAPIHHLRQFSNFLRPRPGLLNPDTGRMVAAVLSAILPTLLATLSLLTVVIVAWQSLARVTLIPGDVAFAGWLAAIPGSPWTLAAVALLLVGLCWKRPSVGLLCCGVLLGITCLRGALLLLSLVTLAELAFGEWAWRRLELGEDRLTQEGPGVYLLAALCAVGLAVGFGWLLLRGQNSDSDVVRLLSWWDANPLDSWKTPSAGALRSLFSPTFVWGASAGALVLVRFLCSFVGGGGAQPGWMYAFGRAISRLFMLSALWAGLALCWLGGLWLHDHISRFPGLLVTALAAATTALMGVLARAIQKFFSRQPSRPSVPGQRKGLSAGLLRLLAAAIVVLLFVGVMALATQARQHGWQPEMVGVAVAFSLATLFLFDTTQVGLHPFYRARLARAYLGAAHAERGRAQPSGERKDDDLLLTELVPPGTSHRPLHLICCAANDLRPKDPLLNLGRGAQSAVLSAVGMSVAHEAAAWGEADALRRKGRPPTLAAAMTASGAAFNSNMGSQSKRLGAAVTFLMSAFNLRLGLWWPHPTRGRVRRLRDRRPGGLAFYKEMFGASRAQGRDVHLSDGGHFENLALYELVRRHCRYVLISDCGMDPDVSFDDFGNAVRRVREDFGVDIRIDLSPLRPGPDGKARQPMVAGDIFYPTGDTGVLLMIKPTLMGTEPADIAQYKARNTAFPHESTGDQFYDEAQWESYRRLGEHVAESAFRPILRQLDGEAPEEGTWGAVLFAQARREWLPLPSGYTERFARFAARAAEIDALLHAERTHRLLREVFEEEPFVEDLSREEPRLEPDARRRSPRPRASDIIQSLQVCRRALLFMEEVFLSEALDDAHGHPAYLGLMNYFARWTTAPLFRMWWPLLKTLYPQRFTRFLETQFRLEPERTFPTHVKRGQLDRGLARSLWEQSQHGPEPKDGAELLSFLLPIQYRAMRPTHIQLAQVLVHVQGDGTHGQVATWDAEDFFVPPGFWGIGIGEAFLHRLAFRSAWLQGSGETVSRLAVHIGGRRSASAEEKKRQADEAVLYRSSGFREPDDAEREALCAAWTTPRHGKRRPLACRCSPGDCPCLWLVRDVKDDQPIVPYGTEQIPVGLESPSPEPSVLQ